MRAERVQALRQRLAVHLTEHERPPRRCHIALRADAMPVGHRDDARRRPASPATSPVDADLPQSDILAGGRLLIAMLVTVLDGASEVESLGFLDIEDLPP